MSFVFLLQSWDTFFKNAKNGLGPGLAYQSPPDIGVKPVPYSEVSIANGKAQQKDIDIEQIDIHDLIQDHLAVFSLIRGYQVHTDFYEEVLCTEADAQMGKHLMNF